MFLARRGRPEGFRAIYLSYGSYLFTLAIRMLRNREAAEDATQEAFAAAFRSLDDFRGDARLKTWLYTILYRAALKVQEKGKNEIPSEVSAMDVPESGHSQVEDQMAVKGVLEKLETRDRAVLVMSYWDDLSCREIGEILGFNENHVKVLLFRARERFARLWKAQENLGRGNT